MWPTVWVRSNVICNPIYHYQFGMKTCYIYIYIFIFFLSLRKRDHQGNLLAYIQCFCFRYAKCNSIELLTHICWSFRKYMKKVFRRKSTITEFKIERNRILSLLSFPSSILDAPCRVIQYFLAGFCETQVYKSGWHCNSLLMRSVTEFSEEEKWFISLRTKRKQIKARCS